MGKYALFFIWLVPLVHTQIFMDKDSGFQFPQTIGHFSVLDQKKFAQASLGVYVGYHNDKEAVISTYVYAVPPKMQQQSSSTVLSKVMHDLNQQILLVEKLRFKSAVSVISEGEFNVALKDGANFLGQKSSLVVSREMEILNTITYIFFFNKSFFFKVRATFSNDKMLEEDVDHFVRSLLKAQKTPTPPRKPNLQTKKIQQGMLKLIDRFLQAPLVSKEAPKILISYAIQSDAVQVIMSKEQGWMKTSGYEQLFIAAYVAGNIRKQLMTQIKKNYPEGGDRAVVRVYSVLKKQLPGFIIREAESLVEKYAKNANVGSDVKDFIQKLPQAIAQRKRQEIYDQGRQLLKRVTGTEKNAVVRGLEDIKGSHYLSKRVALQMKIYLKRQQSITLSTVDGRQIRGVVTRVAKNKCLIEDSQGKKYVVYYYKIKAIDMVKLIPEKYYSDSKVLYHLGVLLFCEKNAAAKKYLEKAKEQGENSAQWWLDKME
ncbi:hypothetical protein [Candidatus Uabimicrobium amorphum]|uniref:Uncharacterized protein n=1 Tax=Uabimicrobium amorphum TaxID=2596890 RepID=A0A5S9ITQ9_UABAM|nr:hypothetical protein [Candidatus Uabimicrobium amorphum]BBM87587.1 hypothetical protein UABAM_05999 [Candidatus Uabimicrobium amorphum]